MNITSLSPIGIFDSGMGGLTVARAIVNELPNEDIIYFGDTAHVPYGDKSAKVIQKYSMKICDMLLEQNCKMIVIACNSASSAAYDLLKEHIAPKVLLFDVIGPIVNYIKEKYTNKTVGLIGTRQTISSNVYKKELAQLQSKVTLKAMATPLLVPMIEDGLYGERMVGEIVEKYLSDVSLADIDALILGCTHYSLIKKQIKAFYGNDIEIIDGLDVLAKEIRLCLTKAQLINVSSCTERCFYVSDHTDTFEKLARLFFGECVSLKHYSL